MTARKDMRIEKTWVDSKDRSAIPTGDRHPFAARPRSRTGAGASDEADREQALVRGTGATGDRRGLMGNRGQAPVAAAISVRAAPVLCPEADRRLSSNQSPSDACPLSRAMPVVRRVVLHPARQ